MPLYLDESDVTGLITVDEAVPLIEDSFRSLAAGELRYLPRRKLAVDDGYLAVMSAVDDTRRVAGLKSYTVVDGRLSFVVCLFDLGSDDRAGGLAAVIEAQALSQIRTAAASAVAAQHLARPDATSLGLIGTGFQATAHVARDPRGRPDRRDRRRLVTQRADAATRSARTPARARPRAHRARPACDIVVTATTAKDPVLRGEWLREGALVIAIGANEPPARELDNVVLQRASFVCCDSLEQSRYEAADLIEPVESGTLDWLEVHELQEVVTGLPGRQADEDVVVFKSNGIAAWDVVLAAELLQRALKHGVGAYPLDPVASLRVGGGRVLVADGLQDLGAIEQALALVGRQAVRHVLVLHDLGERATTVVLADHVLRDAILGRRSLEEPGEEVLEHDPAIVSWSSVRRRSSSGRFAERVLSGVDDAGLQERIVFWVERRDGGVWLVGRAVNPQLRQADDTRPEDILFEGYELDDALDPCQRGARGRRPRDRGRPGRRRRQAVHAQGSPSSPGAVLLRPVTPAAAQAGVAPSGQRPGGRTGARAPNPATVLAPCGSASVTAPIPTTPSCTGG